MSNEILGAGGSTRMARNSVFGNQLQRGGITNAGSILGALSGSMGESQASQQAAIKVLAEGTKLGLDDSKFAEENRRFTQTVAQIVAKSGARGEDVNAVTGGFGRFLGEKTNAGIEGAKSAYEQYQSISSETSGPRGVMRAAGMMRDKDLSKIDIIGKQALMQIREEDFNDQNPVVRNAARQANLTVDELRQRMGKVNEGSQSRFKQADQSRDYIRAYMQKNKISRISEDDYNKMPEDVKAQFDSLSAFQTTELGDLGTKGNAARAVGTVNQNLPMDAATRKAMEDATLKKYTGSDQGREEDKTVQAMAESGRLALDSFRQFHNEMIPTVKNIHDFNEAMSKAVSVMKTMSTKDQDYMSRILGAAVGVRGSETQNQAGKNGQ
jgi:hypothetical protein